MISIRKKENITSLELVALINDFRKQEKGEKLKVLRHDTLLEIIRDEFEEEISLQNILESTYVNSRGKTYPMFILDLDQARQVLVRESKFVRKRIFEYIKKLEQEVINLRLALQNKANSDWLLTRQRGKLIRRNETDVIAKLIPYAREQGSRNADKLYLTYSKLTNSLAGISGGMRDTVDIETLLHIKKLEDLFSKIIADRMQEEAYYKEIYKECKRLGEEMMKFMTVNIKLLGA